MTIEQNTPEWLEMRKNYLGASDAPIVMGVSKWCTPLALWEEKLGISEPRQTNARMLRGHELEPEARKAYSDYTGVHVDPKVVFHPEIDYMMASLDGISPDGKTVVEIKCAGKKDHETAKQGRVPDHYYPQLQHQLAVIGVNMLHYFSYSFKEYCIVNVARDDTYIEEMIAREKDFWECLKSWSPPESCDKDFIVRDDAEWCTASNQLIDVKRRIKEAELEERRLKDVLVEMAGGQSTKGGGVKVQKITRRGAVDYKSIDALKSIDLDEYRKPPSVFWKVG